MKSSGSDESTFSGHVQVDSSLSSSSSPSSSLSTTTTTAAAIAADVVQTCQAFQAEVGRLEMILSGAWVSHSTHACSKPESPPRLIPPFDPNLAQRFKESAGASKAKSRGLNHVNDNNNNNSSSGPADHAPSPTHPPLPQHKIVDTAYTTGLDGDAQLVEEEEELVVAAFAKAVAHIPSDVLQAQAAATPPSPSSSSSSSRTAAVVSTSSEAQLRSYSDDDNDAYRAERLDELQTDADDVEESRSSDPSDGQAGLEQHQPHTEQALHSSSPASASTTSYSDDFEATEVRERVCVCVCALRRLQSKPFFLVVVFKKVNPACLCLSTRMVALLHYHPPTLSSFQRA